MSSDTTQIGGPECAQGWLAYQAIQYRGGCPGGYLSSVDCTAAVNTLHSSWPSLRVVVGSDRAIIGVGESGVRDNQIWSSPHDGMRAVPDPIIIDGSNFSRLASCCSGGLNEFQVLRPSVGVQRRVLLRA